MRKRANLKCPVCDEDNSLDTMVWQDGESRWVCEDCWRKRKARNYKKWVVICVFAVIFLVIGFMQFAQAQPSPVDPGVAAYRELLSEANDRLAVMARQLAQERTHIQALEAQLKSLQDKNKDQSSTLEEGK